MPDWITGGNATATTNVWQAWNTTRTYLTTTTNSTSGTWVAWNTGWWNDPGATPLYVNGLVSDAERQRAQEAWERAEAAAQERRREAEAAQETARELLLSLLDEKQREDFERLSRFTVIAADGREYRIYRRGKSGNVRLVEKEREVASYCIHDYEGVPEEDTYAAQMLLLQTDPAAFRRIANVTRLAA